MSSSIHIRPSEKGSLHQALGIKPNSLIPASRLQSALHGSPSPALKKKLVFAENARKWGKGVLIALSFALVQHYASPVRAQVFVAPACNAMSYPVGSTRPPTQNPAGAGCISGSITASSPSTAPTAAAVPAQATYVGGNKSGNLTGLLLDGSSNLDVNCVVGCAGGSFNNNADAIATSATNGQTAAWLYGWNGASFDRLQVDGSKFLKTAIAAALPAGTNVIGHVIVDTAPTTAVTGSFFQATQPVSAASLPLPTGAMQQTGGTVALVAGSAVIGHTIADTGSTTAVTGNVTVVQPTGTNLHTVLDTTSTTAVTQATAANLNATVVGAGAAGSANAGVVTIQGIASMTKLLVTPDSVALPANQSVNVNQFGGSAVVTGTGAGGSGIPRVTVSNDTNINPDTASTGNTLNSATPNAAYTIAPNFGEGVAAFTISGLTASGATLTLELSDDGGTTWSTATAPSGGVLASTFTSDVQFRTSIGGHTRIRLRVSSTGSGTITIASNLSSSSPLVTIATVLPPGTNVIGKVGIDQTTPGTTNAVAATLQTQTDTVMVGGTNTKEYGGTSVVSGGVAGSVGVGGLAANNASSAGNPQQIAGLAENVEPTLATNGQNASVALDLAHRQIVFPFANKENEVTSGTITLTASTATTSAIAAPGAGLFNYVTDISCFNTGATATTLLVQNGSGGATIFTGFAPAGGGFVEQFATPIGGVNHIASNTAVFIQAGSSTSSLVCNLQGFKGS